MDKIVKNKVGKERKDSEDGVSTMQVIVSDVGYGISNLDTQNQLDFIIKIETNFVPPSLKLHNLPDPNVGSP